MKLISLNTWAGRAGKDKLLDFFKRFKDVDIFCLQEIWEGGHEHAAEWGGDIDTTLLTDISNVLKGHHAFFRPHYMDWYGQALFIKKNVNIKEEGDIFVFKERENAFDDDKALNHARNVQYATVDTPIGPRTIGNFHGVWNGIHKDDSPERLIQSANILEHIKSVSNPYILCGDFNLMPKTESLKKLEAFGLRNLIKEFNIPTTRSSHYKKPLPFADYILISEKIKVKEFRMLPDEVSDHLAMYLDFE